MFASVSSCFDAVNYIVFASSNWKDKSDALCTASKSVILPSII